MNELVYWPATRIAAAIRAGELSAAEMTEACLARIAAVNPVINAVVQLAAERARDEAAARDAEAARGDWRGPLHGVPITIKDSFDSAGIVTTGGTVGRRDYVPAADATVLSRLRAAGAILLGKSNTPELTFSGETNNPVYGRTRNPFAPDRLPGGSSGGAAAIVACGGSALDIGSDTGGSIREPAHFCGVAGFKPSAGLVPRSGHVVPPAGGVLDGLTQVGPLARSVDDLALALRVIAGPDGRDPAVAPVAWRDPAAVDPAALRIAWYDDNGIVTPAADIGRVLADTAAALAGDGLTAEHARLPGMRELVDLTTRLRETATAGLIQRLLESCGTAEPGPDLAGYLTPERVAAARCIDPALLEAIDRARGAALAFFERYDLILCPPSQALARVHGATRADGYDDWSYQTVFNVLGWPALCVRAGSGEGGLPVAVQIVGAPWRDDRVLALSRRVERLMGGFSPPPI